MFRWAREFTHSADHTSLAVIFIIANFKNISTLRGVSCGNERVNSEIDGKRSSFLSVGFSVRTHTYIYHVYSLMIHIAGDIHTNYLVISKVNNDIMKFGWWQTHILCVHSTHGNTLIQSSIRAVMRATYICQSIGAVPPSKPAWEISKKKTLVPQFRSTFL